MNADRLSFFRPLRVLACVGLVLLCAACAKGDQPKEKDAKAPPPMPVTVLSVQPQRVPIALETVGQAEGSREVEIRARVSGIIEKRLYTEGAAVNAGAVLFVIDPAPYEIAVAQAQAALSQERARRELAKLESDRLKPLMQSRAISQREYDEALSALQQSDAALAGLQANLDQARLNLSYTRVKAPIGGIAGRAERSEGSLVTANTESSLLTTLSQTDPIWVRFALAEADFERIRGAERTAVVKLLTPDGTEAAATGRLNFAGSTVDPRLGTVQLRAELPNPGLTWLPGQFVKTRILAGEQNAILVPQAAVMQNEQGRSVWLIGADGKAEMRPIKTANWLGANWVVTGGLKPGDRVIVDNLMKVRPGAPVQPMEPAVEAAKPVASASR